jgi:hypothetical protein
MAKVKTATPEEINSSMSTKGEAIPIRNQTIMPMPMVTMETPSTA